MSKPEFLLKLDEMLYLQPGTLNGAERLDAFESWDSMAVVSMIALMDEQFGMSLPADAIAKCRTVNDLVALAGHRVQA